MKMPQIQTVKSDILNFFSSPPELLNNFDIKVLKIFKYCLILIICFKIGAFGFRLFTDNERSSVAMASIDQRENILLNDAVLPQQRPLNEYENIIAKRDIFSPSWIQPETLVDANAALTPAVSTGSDVMQYLKVVGIILGDHPQAIIEDSQTRQTYFLQKGESIKGATIEDIKKGRVALNFGGQIIELVQ